MILCFLSVSYSPRKCKDILERLFRVENIPFYFKSFARYSSSTDPRKIYVVSSSESPQMTHVVLLAGATIPPHWNRDNLTVWSLPHETPQQIFPFSADKWVFPLPKQTCRQTCRIMSLSLNSSRRSSPGFLFAHRLVQYILRTGLPVDIYGGIRTYVMTDPRLKDDTDVEAPYMDYLFHLVIEDHYDDPERSFTGKIIPPLLYQTTPIYLGGGLEDAMVPYVIPIQQGLDAVHLFQHACDLIWAVSKDPQEYVIKNVIKV